MVHITPLVKVAELGIKPRTFHLEFLTEPSGMVILSVMFSEERVESFH